MKKKATIGLVAGAVAVGLLAGGTTLALWSDTEDVDGGVITAGNLDVAAGAAGVWYDISPVDANGWTAADTIAVPAPVAAVTGTEFPNDFGIVPGDLLELLQPVTVVATGDNMTAQLTADLTTVTASIPTALQPWVEFGIFVFDDTGALLGTGDAGTVTFLIPDTNADGAAVPFTVKIRLGFDGLTPDQVGILETIDLSAATGTPIPLVLEQIRP
jgi:alternate signal-mediated exported protein